ncbi:MAG TPA: CARDB domain-containing protein, partial [Symbiobacteriaceae bacterium]
WELAKDFDCRSSSDKDESGLRKWGGGIVVLHLFPNLELAPLEVTAQDGFVNVGVRLKNQSPVAGPVHVYYRWESTGAWKRYEQTLTVKPYQNTARGEAVEPFVMRLPGPEKPDKLTVLVWPDPGTGLTTNHPDLGGATSAVLSESGGLDRLFEAHTRELTLRDNMQSAAVQPVFCGDLTVSVNAPARAPDEGFTFTVTATRYGCESLQNVIIDATVNGITQRQRVAFRGQTAVATFESGPQYGESRAWIRVVVDPDNLVRESNEANNWAERSVVLEETWLDEIVCPYDEPPEKCFRSRLYE